MYWGASVEAQTPLYFLPKEIGIKLAAFADAGSLWNYQGPTSWSVTGETLHGRRFASDVRSSVGVGLIWDSPLGPLRFDFAYAADQGRATTVRSSSASAAARNSDLVAAVRRGRASSLTTVGMSEPIFFTRQRGLSRSARSRRLTGADAARRRDARRARISDIAPLDRAAPSRSHLSRQADATPTRPQRRMPAPA